MHKKKRLKERYFLILVLVMFAAAAALLFYAYYPGAKNCGSDVDCFMKTANECKPALLTIDFEGSILEYRSRDGCKLVKKIAKLPASEPEEVIAFLEGKEMVCDYDLLNLNQTWVDNFAIGLEACTGELKDAIMNLRMALADIERDNMAENITYWYDIS